MASILVQAAQAVVDHVAAQTAGDAINQTVNVARKYVARFDAEALATSGVAQVTVVPTFLQTWRDSSGKQKGTRGKIATLYGMDVALHKFTANDADNDSMMELSEQIDDLFRNQRLTGYGDLSWDDTDYKAVFDTASLDEKNIFIAVMHYRFGGFR